MSVGDLPGVVQGDGGGRTVEAQLSPAGEWRMAVYSGECSQYIYTVSTHSIYTVAGTDLSSPCSGEGEISSHTATSAGNN